MYVFYKLKHYKGNEFLLQKTVHYEGYNGFMFNGRDALC